MANNDELNSTLIYEEEHFATPTYLSNGNSFNFQQSGFGSLLSNLDNLVNFSSSDVLHPQIDEHAAEIIEENDACLDVENFIKFFSIQRIQYKYPLRDFPTILEIKEVVVTFAIEPNAKHTIEANFLTQTPSERNLSSSDSLQYNKEFHMHLSRQLTINQRNYNKMLNFSKYQRNTGSVEHRRPEDTRLQAHAKRLLRSLTPVANDKIEYVNNGYGILNPNYRAPILHAGVCLTCRECEITFKRASTFNRHMSRHSNIKRFLCVFCSKGFYDLFDLKRHTRTHTGIRPYQCQHCSYSFSQRSSLEHHMITIHSLPILYPRNQRREKLHVCEDCGESTNSVGLLKTHIKNEHAFKFY